MFVPRNSIPNQGHDGKDVIEYNKRMFQPHPDNCLIWDPNKIIVNSKIEIIFGSNLAAVSDVSAHSQDIGEVNSLLVDEIVNSSFIVVLIRVIIVIESSYSFFGSSQHSITLLHVRVVVEKVRVNIKSTQEYSVSIFVISLWDFIFRWFNDQDFNFFILILIYFFVLLHSWMLVGLHGFFD